LSLSEGARLGAFEIVGPLGKGGMGEVWRARDSKLERDVAIKTLPANLATDKDRLARFEREAKLLASLNHAHIASVYGLDEHDGTLYIAMELVEGATLEDKLLHGAFPVEEALQLGLQITEALEAAHAKGVVHRDLKPANVMVTPDGVVKVLDFGLAKAFSGSSSEASPAHSPTLTRAMTQAGLVLGTAGYMSPEQASGQATDQRADVWSFGVVLYEMLTGLPLFSGESVPHILADVLRAEPDWGRLPKNLHPRVRHALERCLEKKARNRYAGIADARVDLEAALKDPEGVTPARTSVARVGSQRSFPGRLRAAAFTALAGATAAAVVAFVIWPDDGTSNVTRLVLPLSAEHPYEPNVWNHTILLARDASRVYYRTIADGEQSIAVHDLASLESEVIYEGRPVDLFLSPDPATLGFTEGARQSVNRIDVSTAGRRIELGGYGDFPRGTIWLDDGSIIVAEWYGGRLLRLPAGASEFDILSEPDPARGETAHSWPSALPGGEWILHTIEFENESIWRSEIVARHLVTGQQQLVIEGGSDARFVPTGHLVYAYEGELRAATFDPDTLEAGPPETVIDELMSTPSGAGQYSMAADGTLLYVRGSTSGDVGSISWLDARGVFQPVGMEPGTWQNPSLSPDGTRLAISSVRGQGGAAEIFVWSFDERRLIELTLEAGSQDFAIWTPDSERIIYRSEGQGLFARRADGSGRPEMIYPTEQWIAPFAVTDDGSIVVAVDAVTSDDIGLIVPGEEPAYQGLLTTGADESRPALSPGGEWLAYQSNVSGNPEIYVSPFPDIDNSQFKVSVNGGSEPKWMASGGQLQLWFQGSNTIRMTPISTQSGFELLAETDVVSTTDFRTTVTGLRTYDLASDGRLLVKESGDAGSMQIFVIHDWFDELSRLVPVD
jgi:hypothetical protein